MELIMKSHRFVRFALVTCVAALCAAPLVRAQTTEPSTESAPATQPTASEAPEARPAAPAKIDPKAADLVNAMKSAYGKLSAVELAGVVSGNFDVAGQKNQPKQDFTASYQAPNKFRHESKDGLVVGSTGDKLYLYSPNENVYSTIDTQGDKLEQVPQPLANILFGENPSLLMAISLDPFWFFEGATVSRGEDATLDGKSYATLRISDRPTDDVTILVDNDTKLVRRVTLDLRKSLAKRGTPDIKSADFTVDYTTTTPNSAAKPEQFAWTPPAGARDAAAAKPGGSERFDANNDLVGKAAPAIALKDLSDKEVKPLADAKGNVILLDFWATWCPPCVEGMPNLQRIHTERAKDGIKVFAVNAMEEKDRVASFIKQRNLNIPVLLDTEGKAGEAYKIDGWPTSVVIKRDGTIHKILHPVGPEGEKALDEALNEALKAK
jgi:thiol-disulfide isomerase/thioredoxin/outer membrane lipoprotein-sorting protein